MEMVLFGILFWILMLALFPETVVVCIGVACVSFCAYFGYSVENRRSVVGAIIGGIVGAIIVGIVVVAFDALLHFLFNIPA